MYIAYIPKNNHSISMAYRIDVVVYHVQTRHVIFFSSAYTLMTKIKTARSSALSIWWNANETHKAPHKKRRKKKLNSPRDQFYNPLVFKTNFPSDFPCASFIARALICLFDNNNNKANYSCVTCTTFDALGHPALVTYSNESARPLFGHSEAKSIRSISWHLPPCLL